jgi:hypothetical protein
MSDDDIKARMDDAIKQAKESSAGHLLTSIAPRYFTGILSNGYIKECPFCHDKGQTFRIRKTASGNWNWGCYKTNCEASFDNNAIRHDALGLVEKMENLDWKAARDRFLEICGVPNPFKEAQQAAAEQQKKRKKPAANEKPPAAAAAAPPEPEPEAISPIGPISPIPESAAEAEDSSNQQSTISNQQSPPPLPTPPSELPASSNIIAFTLEDGPLPPPPQDVPPTIWEDLYALLKLDNADRELLKRKRGFTKETIEQAGYRSSSRDNRAALAPLLEKYPHPLLLSLGICSKDLETQEVKINAQLTGWGLVKRGESGEKDKFDWVNPVLIPYRDKEGKCVGIRPHKGGLSSKRFMHEMGYERSFRSVQTRSHPYTNWLFYVRPTAWSNSCVLTEGEHKANALGQCGIPAMAVPGIQMPANRIFLEEVIEKLRSAGIREITVCYDSEDKSHKPDPWDREHVVVWAKYACEKLRKNGFATKLCFIPEDMRMDDAGKPDPKGKADWDGLLAKYGKAAEAKFNSILKKAFYYSHQTQLFIPSESERIQQVLLNRALLDPAILTGGEDEQDLAQLIKKTRGENKDGVPWRVLLNVREVAEELFATQGCYFVRKKPPKEAFPPLFAWKKEIKAALEELSPEDLEERAGLEAAAATVKHLIEGRIEILSDFTVRCDFQVRTQAGLVEKLFTFTNKHGEVRKDVSVPPSALSTSSKFRDFCMGVGNFNPMIGDKQLQLLMIDIGTFSAWREIREIEMIGRDKESNIYVLGDCAITDGPTMDAPSEVFFPDRHDIIWYNGIGYRIDPADLKEFAHGEAPKFFQKWHKTPAEVLADIRANPEQERVEVAKIFFQFATDLICTFGDATGLLVIGTMLGYCYAPELLTHYNGHPGLWIHGLPFSGKTETLRFLMQMWGYDAGYRNITLAVGTTNVGIDRPLAQYSDIPLHLDEFRQAEADQNRISTLRMAFNRQAKSKGKMDQTNRTRTVQPHTSPIVTGQGITSDSATQSRYVEAILSAAKRLGTPTEQRERYERMLSSAGQYHRIIRYIMLKRKRFAADAMEILNTFLNSPDVTSAGISERVRLIYGSAFSGFSALYNDLMPALKLADQSGTIGEFPMTEGDQALLRENSAAFRSFSINTARNASDDVSSINMTSQFWTDVMISYGRANGNGGIRRFMWFAWCVVDPVTNRVTVTNAKQDMDGLVRCVIVKSGELYAEYELDTRQRNREPELSLSNVKAQCQSERFWIPSPKTSKNRAHRMSFEGMGQISVWVLRFDRMDASLQAVFSEQFEKAQNDDEPDLPMDPDEKSPI